MDTEEQYDAAYGPYNKIHNALVGVAYVRMYIVGTLWCVLVKFVLNTFQLSESHASMLCIIEYRGVLLTPLGVYTAIAICNEVTKVG